MAYSPLFQFQPTTQVELYCKDKWSLDVGHVKKEDTHYGLFGVSRDINENLDVGGGYTTDFKDAHSWYFGFGLMF